jgi:hypothetical protein
MPMRGFRVVTLMVVGLLALPALVRAQASIAGQVKDASGAVLPGVTVEASSSALIENVRTVVTGGTGPYRIEPRRHEGSAFHLPLAAFCFCISAGSSLRVQKTSDQ